MATKYATLPPRCCGLCGTTEKTRRCVRCRVMFYCSREHQTEHYPTHKPACRGVSDAEDSADEEEEELRLKPPDMFFPENVFETSVGHFWGIFETRDYMRARFAVVEALQEIKTRDSVEMQLTHLRDLMRLCRSDNMGVRDMVPALMLRLGQDQNCYDFIKWYMTTGTRDDYDWGDMSLGFLDIKDADAFEAAAYLCGQWNALNHTIQATLLKVKLLLDLKALQNSVIAVGEKVPAEILDGIQANILLSPIIAENKGILQRRDHTEAIEKLTAQINVLYKGVIKSNKHFWPALLKPGKHLGARPGVYSPGNVEEMQLSLMYNYDSWIETPGAIDVIKEISAKKRAK